MFQKYIGRLGKAEAEWVQEVLDMYDQDERKARLAVIAAIEEIAAAAQPKPLSRWQRFKIRLGLAKPPAPIELSEFAANVHTVTFVSGGRWWFDGLVALGLLQEGENLPAA